MLSFKDISVMKSDSLIRNNHFKHEVVSLEEILEEYKLQRGIMNTFISELSAKEEKIKEHRTQIKNLKISSSNSISMITKRILNQIFKLNQNTSKMLNNSRLIESSFSFTNFEEINDLFISFKKIIDINEEWCKFLEEIIKYSSNELVFFNFCSFEIHDKYLKYFGDSADSEFDKISKVSVLVDNSISINGIRFELVIVPTKPSKDENKDQNIANIYLKCLNPIHISRKFHLTLYHLYFKKSSKPSASTKFQRCDTLYSNSITLSPISSSIPLCSLPYPKSLLLSNLPKSSRFYLILRETNISETLENYERMLNGSDQSESGFVDIKSCTSYDDGESIEIVSWSGYKR